MAYERGGIYSETRTRGYLNAAPRVPWGLLLRGAAVSGIPGQPWGRWGATTVVCLGLGTERIIGIVLLARF